jgi:hypothetical protein
VEAKIEIAAGFATGADDLKEKLNEIPQIKPNESVYLQ